MRGKAAEVGRVADVLTSASSTARPSVLQPNARRKTPWPRCCRVTWVVAWTISIAGMVGGCSRPTAAESDDSLPESLAVLHLFDGPLARLTPARDVTAYEINSRSFCDYAQSHFVMKVPPGASIHYTPDGPFEFPVGAVLAQTLSYADADRDGERRIVETRVLLRRPDKWIALPYVWNDEQTDASLELIGARIEIRRRGADGEVRRQTHNVPNFNDCKRCHRIGDIVTPIAAGVRQLNCPPPKDGAGTGQLAAWQEQRRLQGLPPGNDLPRLACWNDPKTGTVEQRARAWLDANCAHCHNPRGTAANSGLQLAVEVEQPSVFGVLKTPVAAGRGAGGLHFDILPGQPKASIMLYRVRSLEGGIMMPEFGRTQIDEEGAALLSEWIESMPPVEQALDGAGIIGIVTDIKPDDLSTLAQQALAQGDSRRGEEVFRRQELNCTKCHAISGKGANVGPDLATLGTQAKPEHVVESILLPDRIIKEGFRAVTLQTADGRVVTGIQVLDDGHDVVLRDPVRGDTRIAKTEIEESVFGGSLMPANLVAALSRDDFFDLVRYLVELNHHDNRTQPQQSSSP
jgi:uncharacterized repeat protein (TIGR03806 family)